MSFSSFPRLCLVALAFPAALACFGCSSGGSSGPSDFDMRVPLPPDGGDAADGPPGQADLRPPTIEGRLLFAATLGSSANDDGFTVAADKNGNLALGGIFKGTMEFGADVVTSAGNLDGYIVVYDADGKQRFHRTLGSTGSDGVYGVEFDSAGNLIVVGYFREVCDLGTGPLGMAGGYSIFVAKYSPDGTPLWTRAYNTSGAPGWAWAVAVDASDNILVTGRIVGVIDFGDGPLASSGASDVLLFKLRGNGSHVFSKRFGGAGADDYGFAIAAASNGDVLITGKVYSSVDFGGGMLSGDVVSAFIARFGPDGTYRWARRLGPVTGSSSIGYGVAVASSGEIVMTGTFSGDLDCGGPLLHSPGSYSMFLTKYTADGQPVSSRQISGTDNIVPLGGLRIDSWGNLIVGGSFQGAFAFAGGPLHTSAGGEDAFLAKLTPDGTYLLSRSYGNLGQDLVRHVAVDSQANMLASGQFENRVDFGRGPVTSNNLSSDAFLIRLSP